MKENNESKYNSKIWKELFVYFKEFKKEFFILIGFMIVLGLSDVLFPMITKIAIDDYIEPRNLDGFNRVIIMYLTLASVLSITVYLFIKKAGELEAKLLKKIRRDSFDKLQKLSFTYYDKNSVGWMITRVTSDAEKIASTITWGIVDIVWGFTMMLGITIVMLIVNWQLALITLITVPLLGVVSLFFQKRMLSAQRIVRSINSKITSGFNDGIQGAKTTKTLVREELNKEEFGKTTEKMKYKSLRAARLSSGYLPMTLFISSLGIIATLFVGSSFTIAGIIGYGTLVLFITYARDFFDPVLELARIYTEMISAQAAGERVLNLLNEKEDIKDSHHIVDKYGDHSDLKFSNWEKIIGDIEFKNVDFYYDENEYILKNFNLKVKAGEKIALVGETGSGKSTIINLASRFYEPKRGKILIDGKNYNERSQLWLHSNMGYVLQTPHLFSGSIKNNIRYGKLDATEEEIINAAKLVNAHEFIMKFENGYNTEVGEGGGMLSTGEKQLISFARAIINSPSLFFLDEATSSIDTETEKLIQDAIERILEGRTSFIIAHRLSTIQNADKILVIEKGEIIESGSHSQLIEKRGYYFNLYNNQFKNDKVLKKIS